MSRIRTLPKLCQQLQPSRICAEMASFRRTDVKTHPCKKIVALLQGHTPSLACSISAKSMCGALAKSPSSSGSISSNRAQKEGGSMDRDVSSCLPENPRPVVLHPSAARRDRRSRRKLSYRQLRQERRERQVNSRRAGQQ